MIDYEMFIVMRGQCRKKNLSITTNFTNFKRNVATIMRLAGT